LHRQHSRPTGLGRLGSFHAANAAVSASGEHAATRVVADQTASLFPRRAAAGNALGRLGFDALSWPGLVCSALDAMAARPCAPRR